MNKKILEQLALINQNFLNIEDELAIMDVNKNLDRFTQLKKEQSHLEPIIEKYNAYLKVADNLKETKEWLDYEKDSETIATLKEELKKYENGEEQAANELKLTLLPQDANNEKNVIVEIRGAVGGDEANIFAGDLYRLYLRYADNQNWKVEPLEAKESPNGGFSYIAFLLKGKHVFSKMKFEAGGHRVQRVPKTEGQGRIHTSIATVAILPEVTEVEVNINPVDLKIDTYRSSGAGGQHVNTTDSAVRVTHLPTNIVVTSQDGRSQHDNKDKAMKMLRAKLYEQQLETQQGEIGSLRKSAIGTGDRSEKIRTYNYPQNRVTDHRINLTLSKLDRIMEGYLDEIIIALMSEEQKNKLENLEKELVQGLKK